MRTSENGVDLIKSFETLELKAYFCPAGKLTIGYGHTGPDVHVGMVITEQRALELLEQDLLEAERAVDHAVKVPLNQNQFDALVSIIFNVGPGRVGARSGIVVLRNGNPSTLLRNLNAGNYEGAYNQFPAWCSPGTKFENGLLRRRHSEQALWKGEDWKHAA